MTLTCRFTGSGVFFPGKGAGSRETQAIAIDPALDPSVKLS
ncbi:MAG: hypothetical protein ACK58N_15000 [Synechocystis sp.]